MRDHIKILGILNIVLGSLSALAGLVILVAAGTIAGVVATAINSADDAGSGTPFVAAPLVAAIGLGIAIFFVVLGLPAIVGGWGLLHFRPWSRLLMLIVSVFHLIHVPIGTAVGVYGLWVLTTNEGRNLLESGGLSLPSSSSGTYAPTYVPPRV